ncbi:hypothetical protein [Aminobacter carboxidus]|uniref:Uncharacterized protein n=1 Tax=Aminobacter carboxidus TaxID=376165 RepID=A0ABR9GXI3_9HYPH|nr:hypothetical protein [Aminobacter carboxidus]MBE1208389.1 hypothetical protein [Aminobacter carboxidus]
MNASKAFATDCGYAGQSPVMLDTLETIRRRGIAEARKAHFARKKLTDAITSDPELFQAMIHPAQSIAEALEDIAAFIIRTRNMPTWRRHNHAAAIARAKARRLHLRFFRRFATEILARKAA